MIKDFPARLPLEILYFIHLLELFAKTKLVRDQVFQLEILENQEKSGEDHDQRQNGQNDFDNLTRDFVFVDRGDFLEHVLEFYESEHLGLVSYR